MRYRRSLLLFLFLTGLLAPDAAKAVQPTKNHRNWFHMTPPSRIFSSQELLFLQKFKGWFRKHHLRAPRYDVGLREAAWHLAQRMSRVKGRSLSHSAVNAALWLGGRTDRKLRIFGQGYRSPKALWKALHRSLSRTLAGQRPNVQGFAIAGKQHKVCILLLARRGAVLAPMARWRYVGQHIEIQGRVLPPFRKPTVMLGMAGGRVVRPKVKSLAKGRFRSRWRVDRPGDISVQVLVRDDEGPWLSSQTTVRAVSVAHSPLRTVKKLWKHHQRRLMASSQQMVWLSKKPGRKWKPKAAASELLRLVNQLRKKHKLPLLQRQRRLTRLALSHSKDMVVHHYFAHTSPQKGSFVERFKKLGWKVKLARENIVAAPNPKRAFQLLFQSPVHRANLFLGRVSLTGVGVAKDAKGILYFTQIFVAP